MPDLEEAVADALSAELDPLQKWDVGDRMLAALLGGTATADFVQAEHRRGTLPPGPLGLRVVDDLQRAVEPLAQAALLLHTGVPRALDVAVDLGSGRRLVGTVGGLHGDVLVSTSYSSLGPKHRIAAWVRLLAASAAGGPVTSAVTTGRGPYRRPVWQSVLTPPEDPLAVLRELVALHDEGMREPLPMATGASHAYAVRRAAGDEVGLALDAACKEWEGRFGDGTDRHLAYVLGSPPSFETVTAATDPGPEGTRFGALARRLWGPLLAHETVGAP